MLDSKPSKSKKQTGLGRGFGSLIPDSLESTVLIEEGERVRQLKRTDIVANANQPRTVFDEDALGQLASSIKKHGIIQPIVVTPEGKGVYRIVAGERRWRAAALAGLERVPALVRTLKELEQHELALIENVQRVDLGPLEQAKSIEYLHQQFNISYQQIAKKIGKAEATVSNIVRLLQLPVDAQLALEKKVISEGHARQILALKNRPVTQDLLLKRIINEQLSVRQAEQYVRKMKEQTVDIQTAAPLKRAGAVISKDEMIRLEKRYTTKIHIRHRQSGGKIEFVFKSEEQLKDLLQKLQR